MSDRPSSGSPLAVDLFCGAGGLSNGLEQAGFFAACGVDCDPHALRTYAANHPQAKSICDDIANVDSGQIADAVCGREIDLIAGGPSCQGYSTHGKRIADDPRNFMFKHFARIVADLQPRFVLLENVKGLLTYKKGYFRQVIQDEFEAAGYRLIAKVLLAADYGVPQLRERIMFLGARLDDEVNLSFPAPTHGDDGELLAAGLLPYVTVGDAIGDLPLLGDNLNNDRWEYATKPSTTFQRYARGGSRRKYVSLHQANSPSEAASEVVKLVHEGQGLRAVDPELLPSRFKKMRRISDGSLRKDCTTLYHRLDRSRPAYTITCYFRNVASGPFVHPLEDRSLSYREAARLMSFQDTYEFIGPALPRQIGNAVPPLLAKAVGKHILALLDSAHASVATEQEELVTA